MESKYTHDYYDYCHKDFKRVWHLDRCMAMHMGFWDAGTKRLRDALLKENEILAKQAVVAAKDRVLDAGCGVGGSSIFLAAHYGCHVT
jgi:tocopherol O-methyltransferase